MKEKYLQPYTLFSPEFEESLNQTETPTKREETVSNSYDIKAFKRYLNHVPRLDFP